MTKTLCIIGAGLIIGGTVATICLLSNKKKKEQNICHDCKEPEKAKSPVVEVPMTKVAPVQEKPVYEDVKNSVIGNIHSRHQGATAIIRDSVETIRENAKVSENINNEIDKASAELDKMLSED